MDRGTALSGKLAFSVFCALCACAIAVAAPRFALQSGAFQADQALPAQFTCSGAGVLPPLQITGTPSGTGALAVVVDDADAPGGAFTHLVAWNLPATTESIGGADAASALPAGAVVGTNSLGRAGWGPPCPPPGEPHQYRFHVLALKAPLALPSGADRAAFDQATRDQTLAEATLTATSPR